MKKPTPSSLIYNYCKQRDWRRVEIHCEIDPVDAKYKAGRDEEGARPLHVACSKQPTVRVIQSLLKAYPKAVRVPNSKGELPLHIACRSNASVNVLRTLSDHNPAAASCLTKSGEDPIALLLRTRDRTENHIDFHDSSLWALNTSDLRRMNFSSIFWQKIQVILEAVGIHRQHQNLQSFDDLFVLHAAVSLSWCPAEILFYCCAQFPDEMRSRDHLGRLPLHIAVGCTAVCRSNDTLISKIQLREKSVVISRLLQFFPDAAQEMDPTEPHGRYPLHSALLSRHEWHGGVKDLLNYFPDSAMVVDPVEKLFPFQMASFDLDTAFHLLRSAPGALIQVQAPEKSSTSKEIYFSAESTLLTGASSESAFVTVKPQACKSPLVNKVLAPEKAVTVKPLDIKSPRVSKVLVPEKAVSVKPQAIKSPRVSKVLVPEKATPKTCGPTEVVWVPPPLASLQADRDIVFIAYDTNDSKGQKTSKVAVPFEIVCIVKNEDTKAPPEPPTSSADARCRDVVEQSQVKPRSPESPQKKEDNCGYIVSGIVSEANRFLSEKPETQLPPVAPVVMMNERPLVVTVDSHTVSQGVPRTITLLVKSADGSEASFDMTSLLDSISEFCVDSATQNEEVNESGQQHYHKYKNMIGASVKDNVDHGWRKDIVRKKVWNLHKDLTVRIMGQ